MVYIQIIQMLVSSACAEPSLWNVHESIAGLKNGHSDYSDARFLRMNIDVEDLETKARSEHLNLEGTMTISGGGIIQSLTNS